MVGALKNTSLICTPRAFYSCLRNRTHLGYDEITRFHQQLPNTKRDIPRVFQDLYDPEGMP